MKTKQILVGGVLPLAWCVATIAPFAIYHARLPDPLATHWGLGGVPNGSMPLTSAIAFDVGAAVLAALGAYVAVRRQLAGAILGIATFIGLLFAGLASLTAIANLDAESWQAAAPLSLAVALVLALGAAAVAAFIASQMRVPRSAEPESDRASIGLGPKERAAWSATTRNRVVLISSVVMVAAAGLATLTTVPRITALVLLVTGVMCAAFAEIQVKVGESGVTIAFGVWHFPRIVMPLSRIREARSIDVRPMQNGGWGYRGSLNITGKAAVVVRAGEGMELLVDGDKKFIVTTNDSATAAGLVNDLVARSNKKTI